MWKYIVVVLAVVCFAEAGKRGNNRRNSATRGVPPNAQDVSSWDRVLATVDTKEFSFTQPDNTDQIYALSVNKRQLKKDNFQKSKVLYDFTNGISVVLLKAKKWCLLLNKPQDLTKQGVLQQHAAFNGQRREATTPVQLYAIELDSTRSALLQGRTAVTTMCGSKPVKGVSSEAPADSAGAKTILVTTPEEQLSITVPSQRGRGGRRGGGEGRGSRRRNRGGQAN